MTRSPFAFPFPCLIADVGGTNARFAWVEKPGDAPSSMVKVPTHSMPDFASAAREALRLGGWSKPKSLLVGAAGPVTGKTLAMSNAQWLIDGEEVAAALGLEQGLLLNDFETLALTIPTLGEEHLRPIGEGRAPQPGRTRIVVGPGTGLGVGALVEVGGKHLPIASEGGHIGFPAETEYEQLIWAQLGYPYDPPEAETLIAGPGLPAFYQAVARARTIWPNEVTPAEIVERALAKTDPIAEETVWRTLDHIARFCSDMALTYLATGGVYLAGGIMPRLAPLLNEDDFRTMFERNETLSETLKAIPVYLITVKEPALYGLAALAANPGLYWLDYPSRLWRAPK